LQNDKRSSKAIAPFKDFVRIYGSAFRDIAQSVDDREKLLRGLVPDMQHRYQSVTELAQREVDRYKGLAYIKIKTYG